ncbi:unnamed protein product [Cylindrotheca closterium]|uniref:Uncharacterized protein n=1 Tax=Cylindrotheca closterium TaxID=2856 RepID=A0AAD2GBH7_9STRA|nr:unnamed protein product [Cylindrotheca closterium]
MPASIASGSSFQSSLPPAGWKATDGDRMLHDDSSDASSSYYFLDEFGSDFDDGISDSVLSQTTSQFMENNSITTKMMAAMMADDPGAIVEEISSEDDDDDDQSSSFSYTDHDDQDDDRPVPEHDSESSHSDASSIDNNRIGIQPLYPTESMSFDTIMEMGENRQQQAGLELDYHDDTHDKTKKKTTQNDDSSAPTKSSKISQNAHWDETAEEYSFFSGGESESPQTLWELLRLQTILGSCTQPNGDSFDEMEEVVGERSAMGERSASSKTRKASNKNNNKKTAAKDSKQGRDESEGWVFFGLWANDNGNDTTHNQARATAGSPNKQALQQELMADLDPSGEEGQKQDTDTNGTSSMIKNKMKSLLGRLKRNASDNVRSVKLAASFATEDGSILNNTTTTNNNPVQTKYAKLEETNQPMKTTKKSDDYPTTVKKSRSKAAKMAKQQQQPEKEDGMFCQMGDQFASLGCYDDACRAPTQAQHEHELFDDFGVDPTATRDHRTGWAQFEKGFPGQGKNKSTNNIISQKKAALNASYNSTETATTADETRYSPERTPHPNAESGFETDFKNNLFRGDRNHRGYPYQQNDAKLYDSEYGREARSSLLNHYDKKQGRRHSKSQRKLSKGLKKMKRRFSKTKAEI